MNYHLEEQQASRLKEILFPKKTRASRSTLKSFLEVEKENQFPNTNFLMRDEIDKLKRKMQLFLQKQQQSPNSCIATPRECLQIIKLMTDNLENYGEDIKQAVVNLIQNVPSQPPSIPHSKFFLLHLKFNYLFSSIKFVKQRIFSETFDLLKQQNQEIKQIEKKQIEIEKRKDRFKKLKKALRLCSGFGRWRLALSQISKEQIEQKELYARVEESTKGLKFMTEEGKLVLWLQTKIVGDCDVCEILVVNQREGTLRGHVSDHSQDHFSSVFETVENQSQNFQESRGKIKRVELTLDHSLTKIAVVKKQGMHISELKKDPDFSSIDCMVSTQGVSSRDMAGGAILTPLINSAGKTIGIVRQYYFDRPGFGLDQKKASWVSTVLQNGIRTSTIFEQMRQKAEGIRKQYFLKSIKAMNQLCLTSSIGQVEQKFHELLEQLFPIESIKQFSYEMSDSFSNTPKFVIKYSKQSQHKFHMQILSALGKMNSSGCDHIFNQNLLLCKTLSKVYLFELKNDEDGRQKFIPVPLVKNIIMKKEGLTIEKQNKEKQQLIEKQEQIKKLKKKQVQNRYLSILDFCLKTPKAHNISDVICSLQLYCDSFLPSNFKVHLKIPHSKINPSNDLCLFECSQFEVVLSGKNTKTGSDIEEEIGYLCSLSNYLITSLINRDKIDQFKVELLAQSIFKFDDPLESTKMLVSKLIKVNPESIKLVNASKAFEQRNFVVYVETSKFEELQSNQRIITTIHKYGQSIKIPTKQYTSVMYINSSILILIDSFISVQECIFYKISDIFTKWVQLSEKYSSIQKSTKNTKLNILAINKLSTIALSFKRKYFCTFKLNCQPLHVPQEIYSALCTRINLYLLGNSFSHLKKQTQTYKKKQPFSKLSHSLSTIQNATIKLSGAFNFFKKCQKIRQSEKGIKKIMKVLKQRQSNQINVAFWQVKNRPYNIQTHYFFMLQNLTCKILRSSFEKMKRVCEQTLFESEKKSQYLVVSSLTSFKKLSQYFQSKYPQYSIYLELKSGTFLHLNSHKISQFQSLPKYSSSHQFIEYTSSNKIYLKNVIWFTSQENTLSLLEKHYLKALSKSIEESFQKFMFCSSNFFFFNAHFQSKWIQRNKAKAFFKWRQNIVKMVKAEDYKERQKFYQINVEIENLKILDEAKKMEQKEREEEVQKMIQCRYNHEGHIREYKKQIESLQSSSRRLQEFEIKQKRKRLEEEKRRVFLIWRTESKIYHKIKSRQQLQKKIKQYNSGQFLRVLHQIVRNKQKIGFKSIQYLSQIIRQKRQKMMDQKKCLKENHNCNRLMTFQDELENIDEKERDISIIPISFKQFETSYRKENVEVSEEEARRMNGGSYKLNQKTLKFLKRMGKID